MDQVTMTNFDLNDAYAELSVRIDAAHIRYGGFASTHEALGVALEEWNELVQAIQSNDMQSVSHMPPTSTEALRRRFVTEPLGAWIDRFAAAVEAGAETVFYRELAALTGRFVGLQAGWTRAGATGDWPS